MSIKSDIERILKDGHGIVTINDYSYIDRWTRNALGEPCDLMEFSIGNLAGYRGRKGYMIKSRDYEGIITEIMEYTKDFLQDCTEILNKRQGAK